MDRRVRGTGAVLAVGAVVASTVVAVLGVDPALAAPTLTVPVTTVAVGQPLTFTASDCPESTEPGVDQGLEGGLVVGTGGSAVRAGIVDTGAVEGEHQVIPMGWVDPDEPAFLVVHCFRDGPSIPATVVHTYPEVAIDVVPPAAPVPTLDFSLSRTTLAGGQALGISGTGCDAGTVDLRLFAGSDLSFRTISARNPDLVDGAEASAGEQFDRLFDLNVADGPLPEGPYVLAVYCDLAPEDRDLARSVVVQVVGTRPTDSLAVQFEDDGRAVVSGLGCSAGQTVRVTWEGQVGETADGEALLTYDEAIVTPAADGSWQHRTRDAFTGEVVITATCGDPAGDGFRYLDVDAFATVGQPIPTEPTVPVGPPVPSGPAPAVPLPGSASYAG